MEEAPVVDAEVVPDGEPRSTEVVVAEAQQATLFRTDDPVEVIQAASRVAGVLKDVLQRQNLTTNIQGRAHVRVEGWQTVGSMLGVFAVLESVEELPWPENSGDSPEKQRGKVYGFKARYRAQRTDGAVVGGGEADCRRSENTWRSRDDYALKSMAQTRAMSKALKAPLGFIITMAGFEATPADEMPTVSDEPRFGPAMHGDTTANLGRAMTYLIGDAPTAIETYGKIEKDAGGYLPDIVARAILHVARAARDFAAAKPDESKE